MTALMSAGMLGEYRHTRLWSCGAAGTSRQAIALSRGFEEREAAQTPWSEENVVCERVIESSAA